MMKTLRHLAVAILATISLTVSAEATTVITHPYQGITYITRTETSPRAETMHIVQVDLTAPGISFMVTSASGSRETVTQRTTDFLDQQNAQVAINANFFVPFPSPSDGTANLVGLAASQGNVYSAFEPQPAASGYADQSYAILPYAPGLNIDASNHATIVHRDPAFPDNKHTLESATLWNAVSGSAQIVTAGAKTIPTYSGTANGGLNTNGTYSDSNSWYNAINARTSVGLSADGSTLTLFTVDKAGGSLGMPVGEVADMLINSYGVYNALNLDGGGSTSMALRDPVTHVGGLVNASSDNSLGRLVGGNLAVFAVPEPATLAMLGSAMLTLLACKGRRQKNAAWVAALVVSAAALGFGGARSAEAAVVSQPYTQDFSGGAADFVTGSTGGMSTATWTAANGVYTDSISCISGASFYSYSSVQVSNLGGSATAGTGFKVSSLMENMSIGDTSVNVTAGLRFLASTTNTNTASNAYVVDMNIGANPGRVRLVKFVNGAATIYPSSTQTSQLLINNFSRSDNYQLDVYGSYDANNLLDIQVRVTDLTHPGDSAYGLPLQSFSHTANGDYGTSPSTANYFGYYESSSSGANTTINVTWDNFSVVPEPATICLLAGGGVLLARRRRKAIKEAGLCVLAAAALGVVMSASPASAAVFTLSDGNSSSLVDTGTPGMTDWVVDGVDQLARQCFWFRVGSAAGESSLGALPLAASGISDTDFNGSNETLFLRYLGASFQADVKFILMGGSTGSRTSDIAETIRITNTSASSLDFHFFQYVNLHLTDQAINYSVQIRGGNTAIQTLGPTVVSETADVPTPTRHEAGLASDILSSLTDGSPTTLNEQTGPTGPGDLAWAFQWDTTLAPGGSLLISKDKHVVPETTTLGMLILGALAARGHARKYQLGIGRPLANTRHQPTGD